MDVVPAAFLAYKDAVWADPATDPPLLERCRAHMALLLGHPAGGAAAPPVGERERAAVAFAEQWVCDASEVSDELCARLRAVLTDEEATAFTIGLSVVEAELRVDLALGPGAGT